MKPDIRKGILSNQSFLLRAFPTLTKPVRSVDMGVGGGERAVRWGV